MKIHCALRHQNEIEDVVPNLENVLPFVDSVTLCDGGSNPNTFMYLKNWSSEEPKLRLFLDVWRGNFPQARNVYLDKVKEVVQPGEWCLFFDADEYIELSSLEKMQSYISIAEKNNKNMIGFQCRSVSLKGKKRVWENMDNFWKCFLVKWDPNMRYAATGMGTVHEHWIGMQQRIWHPGSPGSQQQSLIYEHRKQENIIWLRGARNFFLSGGGPNGMHAHLEEWRQFKDICASLNINGWHELYSYMVNGNIDQRMKDWMIAHRQDHWGDGSSEFREVYKSYYRILHGEEEPQELRNEHID